MKRIVFIGAPGSGKSVLAASVFATLKQSGYIAEHVQEFVRSDIQQYGAMTSIWEQYRTRQFQKELEDAVPNTADFAICDSGTLTPYFYAVLYSNPAEPRHRLVLQDMYRYLIDDLYLKRYDMVFYLPTIAAVTLNDGTRFQNDDEIAVLNEHMRLVFTKLHRLPNIYTVDASFDRRLGEVIRILLGDDYLTSQPEFASIRYSLSGGAIQNY